jgi:hypothetical protein
MSEAQKRRYEDPEERRKISEGNAGKKYTEEQRRNINAAQKKRSGTDPDTPTSTCDIIKKHHEILSEDPERLSSDFIQKMIGIDCSKVEISPFSVSKGLLPP